MNGDIDAKVQRGFDRDGVALAVTTLSQTMTDGHADPADNPEMEAAVVRLADLLGNVSALAAAEGVQLALLHLWTYWRGGEP